MKRFSEQLHKKSQTVKLRAAEKRELRERVVSYMEYHPLPAEMKSKKVFKEPTLLIDTYREVSVPFKLFARMATGFAVLILIMVPVLAERTVPGDSLYAVKVKFNEEVRSTLAFDTIQKVEWETERLNRRIAEARLLASEGRLTDEVEAEVVAAVRTHSQNAQKGIEVLRTEDADEATLASIAFETTLSVQSAALSQDKEDSDEVEGSTSIGEGPSILAVVVEETRVQTTATNASSSIPAFDKVMAKVERNTTRAYELLSTLESSATDSQIAEVTRRLEDIERSIIEAMELRVEDDELARALLIDALQRTQKLIVFMTDIEVTETVDIQKIVPVILTEGEEVTILTNYQTELNTNLAKIEASLVEVDSEDIIEKATAASIEIEELMTDFSVEGEFEVMELKVVAAIEFTDDILKLFNFTEVETPAVIITDGKSSTTETTASSTDEVVEEIGETEVELPEATSTATSSVVVDTE